jgi:hypothetical protein
MRTKKEKTDNTRKKEQAYKLKNKISKITSEKEKTNIAFIRLLKLALFRLLSVLLAISY